MQKLYPLGYMSALIPANDIPDCQCGTLYSGKLFIDEHGNIVEGDDWGHQWEPCCSDWHTKTPEEQARITAINKMFGTSGFRY